jgi:hypothetical protein
MISIIILSTILVCSCLFNTHFCLILNCLLYHCYRILLAILNVLKVFIIAIVCSQMNFFRRSFSAFRSLLILPLFEQDNTSSALFINFCFHLYNAFGFILVILLNSAIILFVVNRSITISVVFYLLSSNTSFIVINLNICVTFFYKCHSDRHTKNVNYTVFWFSMVAE